MFPDMTALWPDGQSRGKDRLTHGSRYRDIQISREIAAKCGAQRATVMLWVAAPDHPPSSGPVRAVGGPPAAWLERNVGSKAGSPLEGQACVCWEINEPGKGPQLWPHAQSMRQTPGPKAEASPA